MFDGRPGHQCAEKFCFTCYQYHKPEGCFIQKYKPKKKTPYRIIIYDFESEQRPLYDEKIV